jgi:ATP-dependent Clp endopeptidase proteolytic subunit ClpP
MNFRRTLQAFMNAERTPIKAEIPAVDVGEKVATIRLYDPIDSWGEMWGVSAKEFVAALDEVPEDVEEIRLHINSPGGDVFDGLAILNALRNHPARTVAIVDGIAASAASFVAVGCDEVIMARNSELMIHDAWGICAGNAADMQSMAEMLAKNSDNIAAIYAEKAGGDLAVWRAAMQAETWYLAQEAVDIGLADKVDQNRRTDAAKALHDLTIFTYAGRSEAPAPKQKIAEPEVEQTEAVETQAPKVRVNEFRHLVATTRL